MTTFHLQVATVLYADRTDPQVVDARSMPSRVVAATPPGVVLEMMRLTGNTIEIEGTDMQSVHAAVSRHLEQVAPNLTRKYVLDGDASHAMESSLSGNTYIFPLPGDFSYGFPLAHKLEDGSTGELLLSPPSPRAGSDRIWARYDLVCSTKVPVDPTAIPAEEVQRIRETRPPRAQHGRESFLIESDSGQGQVLGWILNEKFQEAPKIDAARSFRFTRMIESDMKDARTTSLDVDSERLAQIADAIRENDVQQPGKIPAGYSFFGQWIAHEITHDRTAGLPTESLSPEQIEQGRSPALDLDSLYGGGPESTPQYFAADQARLRIGSTVPVGGSAPLASVLADLPREVGSTAANIPDPRNDSNLALAQLHVSMIRMHNKMCDTLEEQSGLVGIQLFNAARSEMCKSLQAVTLYDYLRQLVDPEIYQSQVQADGSFSARHWQPRLSSPGMPVEFSVAAFRLGHSMIGDSYAWNGRISEDGLGVRAPLAKLFHMTGERGLRVHGGLPSDWVVNWSRFFDFGSEESRAEGSNVQLAQKIGPQAAPTMHALPAHMARFGSLAKLNLVRGVRVGLPSGQGAAELMRVTPLSEEEFSTLPIFDALRELKLIENTPLWLYLLCEAQVRAGGLHLGPLASIIVLDTLGTLIDRSADSVLHAEGWKPIATGGPATELQFADLLKFAGCEVQCRDLA